MKYQYSVGKPINELKGQRLINALYLQSLMEELCNIIYDQYWINGWNIEVFSIINGGLLPRQNKRKGIQFDTKKAKKILQDISVLIKEENLDLWIEFPNPNGVYLDMDDFIKDYSYCCSFLNITPLTNNKMIKGY